LDNPRRDIEGDRHLAQHGDSYGGAHSDRRALHQITKLPWEKIKAHGNFFWGVR
jgi:hypothetical protein